MSLNLLKITLIIVLKDFRRVDVLLNAWKDIGLALNIRKCKYLEVGHHRGIKAIEHIKVDSGSYEKV